MDDIRNYSGIRNLFYATPETLELAREAAERQRKMTPADRKKAIEQIVEDTTKAGD